MEFKIPNYNQLNDEGGTEVETQALFDEIRSEGLTDALREIVENAIDNARKSDPQLDLAHVLVCDSGVLLMEFQNTVNSVLRAKFPEKPKVRPEIRVARSCNWRRTSW